MEGNAVEKFKEVLSGKEHKNLSVKQCGLFLDKIYPFTGASPDCHKDSCLEIKCPYSICHKSPTDTDVSLPYLKKSEGGFFRLNRNHQYYTQCQ